MMEHWLEKQAVVVATQAMAKLNEPEFSVVVDYRAQGSVHDIARAESCRFVATARFMAAVVAVAMSKEWVHER